MISMAARDLNSYAIGHTVLLRVSNTMSLTGKPKIPVAGTIEEVLLTATGVAVLLTGLRPQRLPQPEVTLGLLDPYFLVGSHDKVMLDPFSGAEE